MIHFDNPQVLYFLLALVPLALAALIRYRRLGMFLNLFSALRQDLRGNLRLRYALSSVFFLLFLGSAIIALAGPRWGSRLVAESRRGTELVLALDLSRSMEVRDMGGTSRSRLEWGVSAARELVARSPETRFGAALGKGSAVLALPLTEDNEAVLAFLDGLSGAFITGRGTNLESLVDAAAGAFLDAFPSRREILLLSDGEALSGSLSQAVERALRRGIRISALGLGTSGGGLLPPESGAEGEVSSLRAEALQSAAARTGGIYLDGSDEHALARLLEHTAALSRDSPAGAFRRESKSQWHIFVLAALAALGISVSAGKKWRQERPAGKARKGVLLCLAALLSGGGCSRIPGKLLVMEGGVFNAQNRHTEAITSYLKALAFEDAAPYAEYGLGCVYLALDEEKAALERFAAAADALSRLKTGGHTELNYRIRYNTGVIHFQSGDYKAAAEEFRRALEADSGKIEAKRNLELSLLSLKTGSRAAAVPMIEGGAGGEGQEVLFDYLRRKEQDRWKSREWVGDTGVSGPDY